MRSHNPSPTRPKLAHSVVIDMSGILAGVLPNDFGACPLNELDLVL
jgi:hypothetical protein